MANTVNLYFDVSKQHIKRTDEEPIASGAINTLVANFNFCQTWDGLYKFCRFEGAGGVVDVRIEDDKCVIPWEVIEAPSFTMACYGTRSTDVQLTTKKLAVKVYQSINFISEEPLPPTPQLVEYYNHMAQNDLSDLATQKQVSAEATARQNADATLQSNINGEASTRAAADAALDARINNIVAGGAQQQSGTASVAIADNGTLNATYTATATVTFPTAFTDVPSVNVQVLNAAAPNIVSVSATSVTKTGFKVSLSILGTGGAHQYTITVKWTAWLNQMTESPAELTDVRVGYDGMTYTTAGDAVREQMKHKEPVYCAWTETEADEVVDGGVINLNDFSDVYSRSNNCHAKTTIPTGALRVKVKSHSAGVQWGFAGGGFYDESDNLLSTFGNTADNTEFNEIVDIPTSADYMMVNQFVKAENYVPVSFGVPADLNGEVTNNATELARIREFVNAKLSPVVSFSEVGYLEGRPSSPNYYLFNATSGLNTGYVRIGAANRVIVSRLHGNQYMWQVAFFDLNKNFIPSGSVRTTNEAENYSVDIPQDAYYVMVCTYVNAGVTTTDATARLVSDNKTLDDEIAEIDERLAHIEESNVSEFSIFAKWGVIGDSLSVGHTTESGGTAHGRNIYYSWPQYMARRMGNTCLNFGKSGLTAKAWMSDSYGYQRLIEAENQCQAYIIALGANDAASEKLADVPIGSINDVDFSDMSNNADTVYGWYAKVINAAYTANSSARVFLFTLPYPRNTDENVRAINEMIRTLAADSHFAHNYLVDLDADYDDYFKHGKLKNQIGNTGWHLTALGYLYASKVNEFALSKVVSDNYAEFQNVPFIPFGSNNVLD